MAINLFGLESKWRDIDYVVLVTLEIDDLRVSFSFCWVRWLDKPAVHSASVVVGRIPAVVWLALSTSISYLKYKMLKYYILDTKEETLTL